jgi:WD40 repeat protein
VAFTPDGQRLLAAEGDGKVRLWPVAGDQAQKRQWFGLRSDLVAAAFAPDGKTVASAHRGTLNKVRGQLLLWDVSGELAEGKAELEGHSVDVQSVAFAPDGKRLASADEDGRILVWDATGGEKSRLPQRQWQLPGLVYRVCFAPDGRHLASANSNGTVYILRVQ